MRRSSLVVLIAVVTVAFGLAGNLAAGIIQVPRPWRPWILVATGLLAMAMVIIEVHRRLPTKPSADVGAPADPSTSPRPNDRGQQPMTPDVAAPAPPPTSSTHEPAASIAGQTDSSVRQCAVSWTGEEDPEEVVDYTFQGNPLIPVGGGGAGVVFLVLYFVEKNSVKVPSAYLVGSAAFLIVVALYLFGGLLFSWVKVRRGLCARSLRVDEDGITVSDPSGDQRIAWAAITEVAVRPIDRPIGNFSLLGLHLELRTTEPLAPPIVYRPAGWPTSVELPDIRRARWVPVCVLGPLPDARRVHLKNTIAFYTKRSLHTESSW